MTEMDGYLHIHHIKLLSDYQGTVDPATDLNLCANCHSMTNRRGTTVTSIEEPKILIKRQRI